MNQETQYLVQLAEGLDKSPRKSELLAALRCVNQKSPRDRLIQFITDVRGTFTEKDQTFLESVDLEQLIQVLDVGNGGFQHYEAEIFAPGERPRVTTTSGEQGFTLRQDDHLSDRVKDVTIDMLKQGAKDTANVQLWGLAEQFRNTLHPAERRFLIGASEELIGKAFGIPEGMTVTQLLKYALSPMPSVMDSYEEGLGELYDRMMESRSASASLLPRPTLKDSQYFNSAVNDVMKMRGLDRTTVPNKSAGEQVEKLDQAGLFPEATTEVKIPKESLTLLEKTGTYEYGGQVFSLPDTIEDELIVPQWFVDKVKAKGGRITYAGVVYDNEVAGTPEDEAEVARKDQVHEQYLKVFNNMVERGLGVIVREDDTFTRYMVDVSVEQVLLALAKSPTGIMGGPGLETVIRHSPELCKKLVENDKRYANRPMGKLDGVNVSIVNDIPAQGYMKFLYVVDGPRDSGFY